MCRGSGAGGLRWGRGWGGVWLGSYAHNIIIPEKKAFSLGHNLAYVHECLGMGCNNYMCG